ncbi:hypothetical protein F4677DRAFT_284719 [Hypoxylon crocopeplum]|nr:hypothetical protein F4677DRAFT_284719 [Hypoxylon crocopeplum]
MSSSSPSTTIVHIRATYTNSSSNSNASAKPFTISTPLSFPLSPDSTLDSDSTARKTAYLESLREASSLLQERVNSELTARMEEEAHEVAASSSAVAVDGKGRKATSDVDEAAEEENYGEEVVEDEE